MNGNAPTSPEDSSEKWEQCKYDLRTPMTGTGLGPMVQAFLRGAKTFDVKVSREPGHHVVVRLKIDRGAYHWQDPVFVIGSAKCQVLDKHGKLVGKKYDCSGRILTEVTANNENAGILNILYQEGESHI